MNRLVFIVIVLNGQYLSCALLVKKKKSHKILVSIMKKKSKQKSSVSESKNLVSPITSRH